MDDDYYDLTGDPHEFLYREQGYVIVNNVGDPEEINETINENINGTINETTIGSLISYNVTTVVNDVEELQSVSWGKAIPALILCLAGITGCFFAMRSLLQLKKSLTTTTHWFLFHVVVSNCVLTLSLLIILFNELSQNDVVATGNLCIARNAILFLSFFSSTFFVVFISIDRYLSSSQTSTALVKRLRSQRCVYAYTGLAWIIAIVLCLPLGGFEVSSTWATVFLSYFSVIYFIAVVISCLFCGVALRMSFKQKTRASNTALQTVSEDVLEGRSIEWVQENKSTVDESYLTLTSAVMIACFFVSWIMLFSVYLKKNSFDRESIFTNCKGDVVISTIQIVGEFLVYANAVFNPYIYLANAMWKNTDTKSDYPA